MASTRKLQLGLAKTDLGEDGGPAIQPADPGKTDRFGQRILSQVPEPRMRHTAKPR